MNDAILAESSPAIESPSSPLDSLTGPQRQKWLETGDLPTKEDPAPSKASSGAADEADEPAPESDPVKKQEPGKKKGADSRIQELLDERHELRTRLEKLEKSGEKKADPPPAPKPNEKKEAALERPKRPKLAEFQGTYEEYEAALEKYEDALTDYKFAADRAEREKLSNDARVEEANAKIRDSWSERVEAAKKDHADYADIAFNPEVKINATADGFILKDALGAKVLYELAKDPAEAARIAALDPFDTMEALIEIKRSISPSDKAPEKKPTTKAPAPPTELGGRNTDPADEAAAALAARDFPRYTRIMNSREAKKG